MAKISNPQTAKTNAAISAKGGRGWSKKVESARIKERFLKALGDGYTVNDACRIAGWETLSGYKYARRQDEDFRFEADKILSRRGVKTERERAERADLTFPEFSERYLKQRLFNHQLQWYDLLEGKDPRNLHPSQRYDKGDPNAVIINTPPEFSKSTSITMNYVTYRICMDPSVRILIVSKTQGMAKKFLNGIKARLTSRRYSDLIREFSPEGGFDGGNAVWRQDMIYVNQEASEDGVAEKDPTVEALGIGGQIYGARADLIIVDDGVTLDNVGGVENQIDWVQQEVMTRLGAFGRMIVVGTRVAPVDLYVELANPKRYPTGKSPWTYLTQPAVLEMNDDPEKWVTLWPKSNMPMVGDASEPDADGLYDYWTGPRLARIRNTKQPRTWAMVYMQQQVDEEAVFPATDVQGCVDGFRSPGRLHPDREGGPAIDKNQGEWYIIAGMDPATVQGFTAITVYGFNRRTQKRRVIEVVNARLTPDAMVNKMKDLTIRFDVDEWRVEKNAFQAFLTQTKEVVQFMASRGVLLREHTTGRNKHDSDFGVSAMAMLFRNWQDRNNMISLPAKSTEGVRALIEQLVVWAPEVPKTQKTDAVMSLWFAELRARELVGEVGTDEYVQDDGWLGANDREAQEVISIDQYRYAQQQERLVGF